MEIVRLGDHRYHETSRCVLRRQERALMAAADNENSSRAECERMVKENDKLRYLQSPNVTIHREVTTKVDEDLQTSTSC